MFAAQRIASIASRGNNGPTTWNFTYSSLWGPGGEPSQAKLSDGNSATYWGSNGTETNPGGDIFLRADFGSEKLLSSISYRAAPTSATWGTAYTNNAQLQCSTDGTSWTTLATIGSDAPSSNEVATLTYNLPTPVSAKYVRIRSIRGISSGAVSSYLGVSEFFFG